jgi:predicted Fe-Mo cluster-binding NifX family protein
MRFAIPCEGRNVATEFQKASHFAFLDANPSSGHVLREEIVHAPVYRGPALSQWLADYGTDVLLTPDTAGLTPDRLTSRGIGVVVGGRGHDVKGVVESFLADTLPVEPDLCATQT